MKRYIIDRFEGDYALCEDDNGNIIELPKNLLPDEAFEGVCIIEQSTDTVTSTDDNSKTYTIDYDYTNQRKESVDSKFKSLFD